jgi:hypothetical protein
VVDQTTISLSKAGQMGSHISLKTEDLRKPNPTIQNTVIYYSQYLLVSRRARKLIFTYADTPSFF